jgi:hypothetical protein
MFGRRHDFYQEVDRFTGPPARFIVAGELQPSLLEEFTGMAEIG